MKLNTLAAVAGAVGAAAIVVGIWVGLDRHWAVLLVAALYAVPGYILAAATAAGSSPKKGAWVVSEVTRGTLIGVNAAINASVWVMIIDALSAAGPAAMVGGIVGGITLLGAIAPVSKAEVYQGLVGWLNWLLPMSWLIVCLGLLFLLGNLLGHAVTGGKSAFMKVRSGSVDWATGTFFIKGGWISNLNPNHTAFNMGNFSFIDKSYASSPEAHEAGHTLNLAAFGWVFHLIGAIDEIVLRRQGNAYSERIAESNAHTGGSNIPMWA
jgi:hypothetical protein